MAFQKGNKYWDNSKNKATRFKKGHKNGFQEGNIPHNKGMKGFRTSGSFKKGHSPTFACFKKGNVPWNKGLGKITSKDERIRHSVEYYLWRKSCFIRDNFTCQISSQKGGELVVHHINNFSDFPELRFAINNGITMTKKLHYKFHNKYGRKNNTKEQLEEFLEVTQRKGLKIN